MKISLAITGPVSLSVCLLSTDSVNDVIICHHVDRSDGGTARWDGGTVGRSGGKSDGHALKNHKALNMKCACLRTEKKKRDKSDNFIF